MRKLFAALASALLPLCAFAQEEVSVTHEFAAFDGVTIADYVDATLIPSDGYSVTITCDPRIEDYIIAYVKDGELNVSVDTKSMPSDIKKLFRYGTGSSAGKETGIGGPKMEIRMPKLSSLTVDGSSTFTASEQVVTDKVSIILRKTSSVSGLSLKADSMYLELSQKGSADMVADVGAVNVQAGNSSSASLRIPQAESIRVNAGSFATVEVYGSAKSVSLEATSSAKVKLEPAL